jgi:hypothetical protein
MRRWKTLNVEDKVIILDKNKVPMIYRNVRGEVVKCCMTTPISSVTVNDRMLLTKHEVMQYDVRLLQFAYYLERKTPYEYTLKKAF